MEIQPAQKELEERGKKLEQENSELLQALKNLSGELEEYRVIFDSIPAMIFFKDDVNTLVRVNQAFADAVGMSKEEIEGKSAFDVAYSRELAEVYWEDDKKVMTSAQPKRDIIEPLITDKTRWFKTDKIPLPDPEGNITGVIGFSVDITSLKRAKEELQRRYEFENLVSNISTRFAKIGFQQLDPEINQSLKEIGEFAHAERSFIFLFDSKDDTIVSVSNAYEWCDDGIEPIKDRLQNMAVDDLYMTRDVLMKLQDLNISSMDDLPADAGKDREVFEKDGVQAIAAVPMFCGETLYGFIGFDCYSEERKWQDDVFSVLHIVGEVIANALERKRTNKELEKAGKESEMRYRTLVETSPDAITMTDLQGRFITANPQELKLLGYDSMEELNNLGLTAFSLIHEEDRQRALENTQKTLEQGIVRNIEYRVYRKDGSICPIELSASVIRDAGGNPTAFMALTRDITERKQVEKELADYRHKLEDKVKERTAELSAAHERLRQAQKMEALGTLAGGIAHEFNNILATIIGYTELSLHDLQAGDIRPHDLHQVLKAAERAKNLVRQILTFSRKKEAELKPLLLNHVITHTVEILERTIPRMIKIKLHLAGQLKIIRGDDEQLQQVLLNLGTNASDAMPKGGTLAIETNNTILDDHDCKQFPDLSPGDYVQLRVSDTGHGIDQDTLQQIFDPFFTTKEVGKGTGLGLSTVFGIIKGHGGHIYCNSEPGKGSTFNIFLPVFAVEKPEPDLDQFSTTHIQGGNETILIVDDEEFIRDIGSQMLAKQGYNVLTASSGEEAIDIYKEKGNSIDLIILDISMPGMGGYNCLDQLLHLNPEAAVIISSGYVDHDELKESLSSGVSGFVGKPFRRIELIKLVRQVLDRFSS